MRSRSQCQMVLRITSALAAGAMAGGCALPRCPNEPLTTYAPKEGYRFAALQKEPQNTDDVFICLCFSGGGTRAAALSYGVLQGLRDSAIPALRVSDGTNGAAGASRTLLDEVDTVSSVSGGSFTAMAYGLDRQGVFDGHFESVFLRRNIQGHLLWLATRPLNLLRLPLVMLDRIDLAANFYNKRVFKNRTYGDLHARGTRPFIVINATNMAMAERFEFTQDDFDILGSDLRSMPVGHAVAASSAFPMLLSPLRLRYYPSPKDCDLFSTLATDSQAKIRNARRFNWAASLMPETLPGESAQYILDENDHKYLHLLDGGLADNLGVTYVIQELRNGFIRDMIYDGRIKKLVVVVVDASTDAPEPIEAMANAPGFWMMAFKTGTTAIYNYSTAMNRVLRYMMKEEPSRTKQAYRECAELIDRDCPNADAPDHPPHVDVDYYLVEINFRTIVDPNERRKFLGMPTSFFLDDDQIDALIAQGRKLLAADPDFQRLIGDLANQPETLPR